MRKLDHWTPRYIVDRSLNALSNFAHPQWPWWTPKAVEILERCLKPSDIVFEWGAGRSTLWLARRVHQITSVEHDPAWFEKVRDRADRLQLANIALKLVGQEAAGEEHESQASAYAGAICRFGDSFDVIIIDGIHRGRCALAAVRKLRSGGMIVVDNGNWYLPSASRAPASRTPHQGAASPEWAEFGECVSDWQTFWTSDGVTDTVIWIAPVGSRLSTLNSLDPKLRNL